MRCQHDDTIRGLDLLGRELDRAVPDLDVAQALSGLFSGVAVNSQSPVSLKSLGATPGASLNVDGSCESPPGAYGKSACAAAGSASVSAIANDAPPHFSHAPPMSAPEYGAWARAAR